jgi:outer membrane protein OmpA-like peptidoglycan-associated protein
MTPVVRACALGFAACLGAVGLRTTHAYADSNVQVDPTVLDDLGPPRTNDTGGPIVLTPPHRETGAGATKPAETKPAETKPSSAATEAKTATAEKPATEAAPARRTEIKKTTPPAEPATKVATTKPAGTKAANASARKPAEPAAEAAASGNRIVFAKGSADLPKAADGVLAPLVKTLAADPAALLSVAAYAAGGEAGTETARRLALSRGLAVRRYLETHGIAGARALIDARSADAGGGPADRVDLAIAKN